MQVVEETVTVTLMAFKSYSEVIILPTFLERYRYLRMHGKVGESTFGFDRIFNQKFYVSSEWRGIRDSIIVRDNGCDLGIPGREIAKEESIYIHHINPVLLDDLVENAELLLDPEYLITTIFITHQAIHYGNENLLLKDPIVRTRNDTCPWRR